MMHTVTLLIIVKSYWKRGFCYLGYEPDDGRIFRPVLFKQGLPADDAMCPVPDNLEVGLWYEFELAEHFSIYELSMAETMPHYNDDIIVTPHIKRVPQYFGHTQQRFTIFEALQSLSKDEIEDIFHYNRYVTAGTNCPSVGVLQCKRSELSFNTSSDQKQRILISGYSHDYNLPFTADNRYEMIEYTRSTNRPDETVLVVLSTGRPFSPWCEISGTNKFDPPRCYILVVGLVTKHSLEPSGLSPQQDSYYNVQDSNDSLRHHSTLDSGYNQHIRDSLTHHSTLDSGYHQHIRDSLTHHSTLDSATTNAAETAPDTISAGTDVTTDTAEILRHISTQDGSYNQHSGESTGDHSNLLCRCIPRTATCVIL